MLMMVFDSLVLKENEWETEKKKSCDIRRWKSGLNGNGRVFILKILFDYTEWMFSMLKRLCLTH